MVAGGFMHTWGFPQCFAAIGGTRIPIQAPHDNPVDYFNRTGWHSIAFVDHEYKFMNAYVGWPGSVHDAGILLTSEVFIKGESGTLLLSRTQRNLWCSDIVRSYLPFTSLALKCKPSANCGTAN